MASLEAEDWPKHVELWRQSGLSQSEYSRQAGISNKKFHYHLHRLKNSQKKRALRFIEATSVVKPALIKKAEPNTNIQLILPNGVQAVLKELEFDMLAQVLKIASHLSC